MTAPRSTWQPLLLADLRAGGRYHAAVERSGATLSRVRREVVLDSEREDLLAGETLGELIREAKREGAKVTAQRRAAESVRRFTRRRAARAAGRVAL